MDTGEDIAVKTPDEADGSNKTGSRRKGMSPIMRRILAINVLAMAVLVVGLLYVGQYRQGLIDNEIAALNIQAELFAAAIGEAAVGNSGTRQKLVAERARQIVRRMSLTTGTFAQLILADGKVLTDSRLLGGRGRAVQVENLPPPKTDSEFTDQMSDRFESLLRRLLGDTNHSTDLSVATK
ncbi:MAG: hypothetical protein HON14_00630, partial [Rhodospirillaceae bacterium]|nr:hypothetical protein [Rhodospirillaceae bacterium]